MCTFCRKRKEITSRKMAMQAINRFLLKRRIFKPTTYTSRKKAFEEKEVKRERGREESRKKGE
jgi:hypothetical protein